MAIFFLFNVEAIAGAWVKKKGKGYSQYSFTYLRYKKLINKDGSTSDLKRTVYDLTLQSYFEGGIGKNISLVTIFPYKYLSTGKNLLNAVNDPFPEDTLKSGSLKGFGNISLGAKYGFTEDKYVITGQLTVSFPAWRYREASGLRTGYFSWGITPSILIGRGLKNFYISTLAGFQFRTNGYSQYVLGNIEFGYNLTWKNSNTWIIGVFDAYVPVTDGGFDDGTTVQTGLNRDGEGHVSSGLKINQSVGKRFWINAAAYNALWADHGGKAPTLNIGIAYEW